MGHVDRNRGASDTIGRTRETPRGGCRGGATATPWSLIGSAGRLSPAHGTPSGAPALAWSVRAAFVAVIVLSATLRAAAPATAPVTGPTTRPAVVDFVNTSFENASPLQWETAADGALNVYLLYDYERASPNRAAGHWHFQLQGAPGGDVAVVLHNFDNVWNGRPGSPVSAKTICYVSPDGRAWTPLPAELLDGNRIRVRVRLGRDGSLYLARLPPYRISDLDALLTEVRRSPLAEVTEIGRTVEGRPLEVVRVGDADAPSRVFLRARSHPWEPGGSWMVQGLIRALLRDDDPVSRRCRARYCVYVMPMANKDGVARGGTRFNVLGKDLNRNWDVPADPKLAPENRALETWLQRLVEQGRAPQLAIDLHNDESGRLHVSRPPVPDLDRHLARMRRLEDLLRKHTWFTEGSTGAAFRNAGTIGEGLLQRYGIDACVLESNCNWIEGLKQHPSAEAYEQFGAGLREVFFEYFGE